MARSYRLGAAFARLSKVAATLSATAGIVTFGSAPLFAAAGKQESVAVATRSLVSLKWIQQAPGAAMAARISSDVRATAASHAEIAVRMASDRSLFEAFASKDRLGSTLLKKLLADFDALEASRTASHEERARLLELLGASLATRSSGSGVETMFGVNGRPRLRVFESAAPRHSSRVESPDGASDSPSAEPAWKDEVDDAIQEYYDLVGYLAVIESDSASVAGDIANGIANGEFNDSEECEVVSGPSDRVEYKGCLDFAIHALGEALGFSAAAAGAIAYATSAYNNFVAFMGSAELAAMTAAEASAAVLAAASTFVASLSVGWIAAAALVGAAIYVAYEAYQCRHAMGALRYL